VFGGCFSPAKPPLPSTPLHSLATDKDTGKIKGYGFCEFYDLDTSIAAQRAFHGRDLGGRALRVAFAEDSANPGGGPGVRMGAPPPGAVVGGQRAAVPTGAVSAVLGGPGGLPLMLPPFGGGGGGGGPPFGAAAAAAAAAGAAALLGAPPPPPGSASDAVSAVLARASRGDLLAVVGQLAEMASRDPGSARALLVAHPQLAAALFQAQVMLGLVVPPPPPGGGVGPPPPQAPPPYPPPPQAPYGGGPSPMHPHAAVPPPPQPPYGGGPSPLHPYGGADPRLHAPPPHHHPAPPPPTSTPDADQQAAMLAQVMSLTEAQVAALPAEHRDQVVALRAHVRARGGA